MCTYIVDQSATAGKVLTRETLSLTLNLFLTFDNFFPGLVLYLLVLYKRLIIFGCMMSQGNTAHVTPGNQGNAAVHVM